MNETVVITKKEYTDLSMSELMLQCLERTGVDNWEGYDEALELFENAKEELKK